MHAGMVAEKRDIAQRTRHREAQFFDDFTFGKDQLRTFATLQNDTRGGWREGPRAVG
jgi:hypothetical protein